LSSRYKATPGYWLQYFKQPKGRATMVMKISTPFIQVLILTGLVSAQVTSGQSSRPSSIQLPSSSAIRATSVITHHRVALPSSPDSIDTKQQLLVESNPLRQDLSQPFSSALRIEYVVPRLAHVHLNLSTYDGDLLFTLADEAKQAGRYQLVWDGTDPNGNRLASGLYRCTLRVEGFQKRTQTVALFH
jgi:hypothetical protein